MKKDGNKLPVKSQMDEPKEKPAKSVMQAIGKSLLKPAKKKKAPKAKKPLEGSPEEEAMESKAKEQAEQD